MAFKSGFSETVFINSFKDAAVRIFSPQREVPFAGHAAIGAVSFISRELGEEITQLKTSRTIVKSWIDGDLIWVRSELRATPPWWHEYISTPEELEALQGPQSEVQDHVQLWSWIDEGAGIVRARTFAPGWGIQEDEANGSGSMWLAATLGRSLIVHHGKGSIIYARPSEPGYAEIGGQVALAEDLILP